VRDVLDGHVRVRRLEGGYGTDPDARDELEPAEVPLLLLLHAAIVAAAAATAMATMTGFGERRMRLIS
jgi:hypothetical protein